MQEVNPETSDEKYLNAPKDILKTIKQQQKIILEASNLIKELKGELEKHKDNGTIMTTYSIDGITAKRTYRPKWIYSEALTKEINLLEHKKNSEQNDGVAKIGGKNYYWVVT